MRNIILLFLIFSAIVGRGADNVLRLTLDDAITLARRQSVDAAVALNSLQSAYWEYRTYRANLLPELSLDATVPAYSKRYNSYQLENGSYTFLRDDNLKLNGALEVQQRIWPTGGTLSLATSLDYVRQLGQGANNRFMSVPVVLRLTQPLFAVNDVKWDRRIEPVRYREAQANYLTATEELAMNAVNYFFNLLSARAELQSAEQNVENATRLYTAATVKRDMGRISENDLLQIELNLLNSQSDLTANRSAERAAMFRLRSFLGLAPDLELELVEPESHPDICVAFSDALRRAVENNPMALNLQRRQLEADYEVARARGEGHQVNLFAQIGFTGTARSVSAAYDNLRGNQVVEVGVSVPLVDWGKRKGKVRTAQSRRDVVQAQVRKERDDFEQNLFVLVERFNNQLQQLGLALRADEIAEKRYNSLVETFLVGKLSALDLNDSQESKDTARRNYLTQMFYYWYYYYQLRSLTLWDYANNAPITN